MNPYLQGWHYALIKLGLSSSAVGAANAGPTPTAPAGAKPTGGVKGVSKPKMQTPWSGQNKMEPKMHETAWQHAQKDLDTSEARQVGKVDSWQQSSPLATGSAT